MAVGQQHFKSPRLETVDNHKLIHRIDEALDGRSDFNSLQHAKTRKLDVHFYTFDLLHLDGENLKDEPLTRRQAMLRETFASTTFFSHRPGALWQTENHHRQNTGVRI